MQNQLAGIVLCGGKSTRMGSDKGLMRTEGKRSAELIAEKLQHAGLKVYYSINDSQESTYDFLVPEESIVDQTIIPGPINGLMSVHRVLPQHDLLLLACDMVALEVGTLLNLIAHYQTQPGFDFYAYHNSQVWEPFCAIYTANGLEKVVTKLEETRDHSFQYLLKQGHTLKLQIDHPESFINRNSL